MPHADNPDSFALVALDSIPAGTVVRSSSLIHCLSVMCVHIVYDCGCLCMCCVCVCLCVFLSVSLCVCDLPVSVC
jgi:hypothetical protein